MNPVRITFENTWMHRVVGRGPTRERIAFAAALLFAIAALGWVSWQRQFMLLEQQRLQGELDQAEASVAQDVLGPPRAQLPAETLRQMDAVTARLNVPWSDVLDAIERRTTEKVALLTLEPDARTGSVALTAEARSLEDLLAYAEALGQDAAVSAVRMGQHELRAQDPEQPVRMTLSINPRPFRQ